VNPPAACANGPHCFDRRFDFGVSRHRFPPEADNQQHPTSEQMSRARFARGARDECCSQASLGLLGRRWW
jgi:hypothetical protein